MTRTLPRRDDVHCHACGALLGTMNAPPAGRHSAHLNNPGRVATLLPGVKVFCDFLMGRAEVICPHCGACGRTFSAGRMRGVVVHIGETSRKAC